MIPDPTCGDRHDLVLDRDRFHLLTGLLMPDSGTEADPETGRNSPELTTDALLSVIFPFSDR